MRDPRLVAFAKAMRREPTPAEARLHVHLRARRFDGVKFRWQKVIGPYIADFSARDPMLVVEVDGDTHADRDGYDRVRTACLNRLGYAVVRYTNAEVMGNLDGVLTDLRTVVERLRAHPSPLQGRGKAAQQRGRGEVTGT